MIRLIADISTLENVTTPTMWVGIPLALISAAFLAVGAQLQHRGVAKIGSTTGTSSTQGMSIRQLRVLLSSSSWIIGMLLLGLAVVLQFASLSFAPIIVVQPLGAAALVFTAIMNTRVTKTPLNRQSIIAITMCVGGLFVFVALSALTAIDTPVTDQNLTTILTSLAIVLIGLGTTFVVLRQKTRALFYVFGAGILYGYVAILAKVVLGRIRQGDHEWASLICLIALTLAALLGAYFLQNAYATGPPDLVIAGMTVIDPLVAVTIGIIVLGEASRAPAWAPIAYVVFATIAICGVFQLAKHHPQAHTPITASSSALHAPKRSTHPTNLP